MNTRVEKSGPSGWQRDKVKTQPHLANGPDFSVLFATGNNLKLERSGDWGSLHLSGQAAFRFKKPVGQFLYSLQFGIVRSKNSLVRVTASINGHLNVAEFNELHDIESAGPSMGVLCTAIPTGAFFRSPEVDGRIVFHYDLLLEAFLGPGDTSLIASLDALDVRAIEA